MPSGSSSRDVSIRTIISLVSFFAALLAAAVPALARSNLDLRREDFRAAFAMTELPAADQPGADSTAAEPPSQPAPAPAPAAPASQPTPAPAPAAPESAPSPPPSAIQPPAGQPDNAASASRPRGAVNPRKALMLSLLLPGAGELYSGHKGRATGFFISEGAIWANFVAWEIAGHLRRDNYIEQAQLNAGVGTDSESDDYWRLVGTYTRSSGSGPDSYEDALRRDARNEFPTDPAAQDAWVAERLPVGSRAWNWSSETLRESYRETRQNSTRAFSRAKFSIALGILNRLASAIDTQMLHRGDARDRQSSIDRGELRLLTDMTADGGGRVLLRQTF